ncbi:MAG: dihydropteroate synthase [Candidatus Altarchaeum sp. CG2_30_32_3053]|nr:MAG: dihydropteroate synthase [Candidatus Altarchaeum sp. CG2_30_32_3053]
MINLMSHNRTKIMGILNVTPDSFYDGSKYSDVKKAVEHAVEMSRYADIIDIGGESSRPGSEQILADIELKRVIPVIKEISKRIDTGITKISIDTTKADVAEEAINSGASIINDISAMRFDEKMKDVAAKYGTNVVLMHMKGMPKTMQLNPHYDDVIGEILSFLKERINFAVANGIKKEKIIIDQGIGFGKRVEDNLMVIKNLDKFKILNCPILVGTSRKSFIGILSDNIPPEERLEGTISSTAIAVMNGADIVRVHDVKEIYKAICLADAIKNLK